MRLVFQENTVVTHFGQKAEGGQRAETLAAVGTDAESAGAGRQSGLVLAGVFVQRERLAARAHGAAVALERRAAARDVADQRALRTRTRTM